MTQFSLHYPIFQLITRQLDFIGNRLTKVVLPLSGLGFPRILLSFILVIFSVFMLASEYGSLVTSMRVYFPDPASNIMTIHISKILSITYIAITLILGIIGLELIGFRHILFDLLFEGQPHNTVSENWSDLKKNSLKPLNFFKIIIGILLMSILFYFAHMQGIMAIDREIMLHEDDPEFKKSEILDKLLYALGFFIPILAGITFMSLEVFLATIAKLLLIAFTLLQKGVAIIYDITKRSVEIITSPIEFVTQRINYSNDYKYKKYLEPIEVKSITGDVNELVLFKSYNKENTQVDEFADHISSKIEDKLNDKLDNTIDELF